MSKYSLIAFDMDGTLLDSNKKISEANLRAISDAVSAGKIITLSTGRCIPELIEPLKILSDVKYSIAVSGALVFENSSLNIIHSSAIPVDIMNELFRRLERENAMIHLLSDLSVVEKDASSHMENYGMSIYQPMFDKITTKVADIREYYTASYPDVNKFNIYCTSQEQRTRLKRELSDLPLCLTYSEVSSLECSPFNTTKSTGLINLCNSLNIPIEETIAVGDADNDIEILKTAGLSVAMGNSNRQVLDISKVTVSDNDHDGCAEAIYKYLLD